MARTDISISRARPEDAATLAKLHVAVWRATYKDDAPAEALALLDEAKRLPYWTRTLAAAAPGTGAWVAREAGAILGVVSLGPSDDPVFGGRTEAKHLYVAQEAQGRGLGKQLLMTAIQTSKASGSPGLGLAVVRQNTRARQFYKAMGGTEVARFIDPGPLWRSENILIAWDT